MPSRPYIAKPKKAMKDGTKKDFPHVGRDGGSYTKSIRCEGSFAVISDEFYNETAIPSHNIKRIEINHHR